MAPCRAFLGHQVRDTLYVTISYRTRSCLGVTAHDTIVLYCMSKSTVHRGPSAVSGVPHVESALALLHTDQHLR